MRQLTTGLRMSIVKGHTKQMEKKIYRKYSKKGANRSDTPRVGSLSSYRKRETTKYQHRVIKKKTKPPQKKKKKE